MPLTPPVNLSFSLSIPPETEIEITDIYYSLSDEPINYVNEFNSIQSQVLVIAPLYPSSSNAYACGFIHSRVKEYIKAGIRVQVVTIGDTWYQTQYQWDGVNVFKGNYQDLKNILSLKYFSIVLVHFVDELLMQIFDGYIQKEKLVFFCHGADVLFPLMPDALRAYFSPHIDIENATNQNPIKYAYFRKYARKSNVSWVFVSEYLCNEAETYLNVAFFNKYVIHNIINEEQFPFKEKAPDLRKKILILRRFDNISQYALDQSIRTILYLSRKSYFNELDFEIYGDGNYFNELVAPIVKLKNVHIHQHFIPNSQISNIHSQCGILLNPSRFDTQGVSLGEAAASGLIPVSTSLPVICEFINPIYKTLAPEEDYIALGNIIEYFYEHPNQFLQISKKVSDDICNKCGYQNTVLRELNLINNLLRDDDNKKPSILKKREPILTIVIPAYNIASYIDKCLFSILNQRNADKLEILIINDGSKDNTLQLAYRYENLYPFIVRVIDKKNGGHGSTINVGIKEAVGKYFRLIDGDDWVDSENLARQIDLLESETVDLMLTKGCYEYVEQPNLQNIIDYNFLVEGITYFFDDLVFENYGFGGYGPLLTTGTYRTQCLKDGNFKISEKKPYVDMEFNAFSLVKINTVKYYDLDIYRYLIGRDGQTVSRTFWKKKYKDHKAIIDNIISFVMNSAVLNSAKKKYIREHLLSQMIDSQLFMYDQLTLWEDAQKMLDDLKNTDIYTYEAAMNYIRNKNGDCNYILQHMSSAITFYQVHPRVKRNPLTGANSCLPAKLTFQDFIKSSCKKGVKFITPYGLVQLYTHLRKNQGDVAK